MFIPKLQLPLIGLCLRGMTACVFCLGLSHKAIKYADGVKEELTGKFNGSKYLCKAQSDGQIFMRGSKIMLWEK